MPLISVPQFGSLTSQGNIVDAMDRAKVSQGQSLANQVQQQALKKSQAMQGLSFGPDGALTPESAQRFAAADPMGYQKYMQDRTTFTQGQDDRTNEQKREGANALGMLSAHLLGKTPEEKAAAWPSILATARAQGYQIPEGSESPDYFQNLVFGQVPVEKQIPKPDEAPNAGSFESFLLGTYGKAPTPKQTLQAKQQWEAAGRAPAAPTEKNDQVVTLADGSFALIDPRTGAMTPVVGQDGKPAQGKTPGMLTGKQLENAKGKQSLLSTARMQLENIKAKRLQLKNSWSSGPFGAGKIPTEVGKQFDAAVDPLRVTIRTLTRTPGEGAMSDYESRLAQAQIPSRNAFESVTDQQIQQLEDYINQLETGYEGLGAPRVKNAPAGIRKPDANALRTKYKY